MEAVYGKYQGTVVDADDPKRRGWVKVVVPAVLGRVEVWAQPCVPYGGREVGFFAVPPVGAQVLVEFEGGNRQHPLVSGVLWRDDEIPPPGLAAVKMWKTEAITVTLNDEPGGGFTIEVVSPAVNVPMKFAMTSAGIELSIASSSVKLTAGGVSINDGALEVT